MARSHIVRPRSRSERCPAAVLAAITWQMLYSLTLLYELVLLFLLMAFGSCDWPDGPLVSSPSPVFFRQRYSFCCLCSKYPSPWETTASRLGTWIVKLITIDLIWCHVIAFVQQKIYSEDLRCFSRLFGDLFIALLRIFWWWFEELPPLTVCMRPLTLVYWTLWSLKLFVNSQNWAELAVTKVSSIVWVVLPRV